MDIQNEKKLLKSFLKFVPTSDQDSVIEHLVAFGNTEKINPLYILKGYAGTGKTSLVSAFVNYLQLNSKRFVLMAPTGRAAKVLSQYTGFNAGTIHRSIYINIKDSNGNRKMILAKNNMNNTVFVVDEASMINDSGLDTGFGNNNLLDDLMQFVFSNSGNKLLLVGDTAQLPPVGLNISPALNLEYLKMSYQVTAFSFEMREVMRQSMNSGILKTATDIREKIEIVDISFPFFYKNNFSHDVEVVEDSYMLEDLMQSYFSEQNGIQGIVITRSNKDANLFNHQIRNFIQQKESRLEAGDKLMVVKNNYFWLSAESKAGFIANGDMIEIRRVNYLEELYGFEFADAEVVMLDYPEEKEITVKILLNSLDASGASLSEEDQKNLFIQIEADYQYIPNKRKRMAAIRKDPYFNALQIKYAYAMTCHKTQGGQWPVVFITQGYINPEKPLEVDYLRWLYTAFTRATEKVFLLGFNEVFFS